MKYLLLFILVSIIHAHQSINNQCSQEGTLRSTNQYEIDSTIVCECKPGYEGRLCETRKCINGEVEFVTTRQFIYNPNGKELTYVKSTNCICNENFIGLTCETKSTKKSITIGKIIGDIEPYALWILIGVIVCMTMQMLIEWSWPVITHLFIGRSINQSSLIPSHIQSYRKVPNYDELSRYESVPTVYPPLYTTTTIDIPTVMNDRQPIYSESQIFLHV